MALNTISAICALFKHGVLCVGITQDMITIRFLWNINPTYRQTTLILVAFYAVRCFFEYIVPTRIPSFLVWVWPTCTVDQTKNEAETSLVYSRKVQRVQNRISPDFSSRLTVVLGCWCKMGNLFGRKKQTRVTEQDKAILVSGTAS